MTRTKEYQKKYYLEKIKPNRKATRTNRKGKNFKTATLLIANTVFIELEKAVKNTEHKNFSKYLEDNFRNKKIKPTPIAREYKVDTLKKKTLTFSENFYNSIKTSGNMSLCIEGFLKEKFKIK